jgi:hypothetical protein
MLKYHIKGGGIVSIILVRNKKKKQRYGFCPEY